MDNGEWKMDNESRPDSPFSIINSPFSTVVKPYRCADCPAHLELRVQRGGSVAGVTLCDPCLAARVRGVRAARTGAPRRTRGGAPSRARLRRAGGTCYYGHALTAETLYVTPSGREQCRVCRQATLARYKKRQRFLARMKAEG
jgi:hypothetical protein